MIETYGWCVEQIHFLKKWELFLQKIIKTLSARFVSAYICPWNAAEYTCKVGKEFKYNEAIPIDF